MQEVSVLCKSEAHTIALATQIAAHLRQGDSILLKGGLAVGKTFFVKALVGALGSDAEVTSPTFTIAHFYQTNRGTFLHVDAYRLCSVAEYRDLGLDDYLETSITAVEWGDRVEGDFPGSLSILMDFVDSDEARRITVTSANAHWFEVISELKQGLNDISTP